MIHFYKDGEYSMRKTEINPKMKIQSELRDCRGLADLRISLKYPVLIIQTTYALAMYRGPIQSLCPPSGINGNLGRKKGGNPRMKEKPLRVSAIRLRGKAIYLSCPTY